MRASCSFRPTGIGSLPFELLTRIFVLGTGYYYPYADSPFLLKPDQEYYATPSSNFQLLVSHVCHQWRQIALQTSSLWNILHFRGPEHLPRAREFLARCRRPEQLLDIVVDTVGEHEYVRGVSLYREELEQVFEIIIPHVRRWRSFHLKIREHDCKAIARKYLGSCGPAPNLETLQLYHFEDYRTVQNLYRATYRPPVVVFANDLPRLKNVSLIGVNLPWENSPYLVNLRNLELALHPENVRPSYESWDSMLRNSPGLRALSLHYSGPRVANGNTKLEWPVGGERLYIDSFEDLSLTDLDPEYLCLLMGRLFLPNLRKLSLDLPHQDFTSFIELIDGPMASDEIPPTLPPSAAPSPSDTLSPSTPLTILSPASTTATVSSTHFNDFPFPAPTRIETLVLTALECSIGSLRTMLRALQGLRHLEVHFARVTDGFFDLLMEGEEEEEAEEEKGWGGLEDLDDACASAGAASPTPPPIHLCPLESLISHTPLLPRLQTLKISGLSGEKVQRLIEYRERTCGRSVCEFPRGGCSRQSYGLERWVAAWSPRLRGVDTVLDKLVEEGWVGMDGRRVRVEVFDDTVEDEDHEENEEDSDEGEG